MKRVLFLAFAACTTAPSSPPDLPTPAPLGPGAFTDTSEAHTVHTTLKMVQTGDPSGATLQVRLPKP